MYLAIITLATTVFFHLFDKYPLRVQKESQSVIVKVPKLNHERGSFNGYIS